jgi:hypothetical protein
MEDLGVRISENSSRLFEINGAYDLCKLYRVYKYELFE